MARLESGVETSTVALDKARAESSAEIEQKAVKVAMATLDFQRAQAPGKQQYSDAEGG